MIKIEDKRDVKGMKFFTVDLDGTKITDCKLMDGKNGPWVSGPSKKIAGRDGDKWINLVTFGRQHQEEIIGQIAPTDNDIPF